MKNQNFVRLEKQGHDIALSLEAEGIAVSKNTVNFCGKSCPQHSVVNYMD